MRRTDDNWILGHVEVTKAAALLLGDGGLADRYDFISASEDISDDPEQPTIFQNLITQHMPAAKQINMPGLGKVPLLFGYSVSAFTEAVGFVANGKFTGTMRLSSDFDFSQMPFQIRQMPAPRFGVIPDHSQVTGVGRLELFLVQGISDE